jgi:hypothetical protein
MCTRTCLSACCARAERARLGLHLAHVASPICADVAQCTVHAERGGKERQAGERDRDITLHGALQAAQAEHVQLARRVAGGERAVVGRLVQARDLRTGGRGRAGGARWLLGGDRGGRGVGGGGGRAAGSESALALAKSRSPHPITVYSPVRGASRPSSGCLQSMSSHHETDMRHAAVRPREGQRGAGGGAGEWARMHRSACAAAAAAAAAGSVTCGGYARAQR